MSRTNRAVPLVILALICGGAPLGRAADHSGPLLAQAKGDNPFEEELPGGNVTPRTPPKTGDAKTDDAKHGDAMPDDLKAPILSPPPKAATPPGPSTAPPRAPNPPTPTPPPLGENDVKTLPPLYQVPPHAVGCGELVGPGILADDRPAPLSSIGWLHPNGATPFIGVDYIFTKPHFSDAQAFIRQTTVVDRTAGVATQTDTIVPYHFDGESSFRAFMGYQLDPCGTEFRFTYWHLEGGSSMMDTATADTEIIGQTELQAVAPGDQLFAKMNVDENLYDIQFSKKLCCGSPCADGCSCCPTWEFDWSATVRIADISRDLSTGELFDTFRTTNIRSQFTGAGPLVGLEGRRYFRNNQFSMYAKGDMGLVLGQFEDEITRVSPGLITTIEQQRFNSSRVAPVVDIEVGGSWKPGCHTTFTAGYFIQSWFDLGATEQHNLEGVPFAEPLDTSNILSFDGLFVRCEFAF